MTKIRRILFIFISGLMICSLTGLGLWQIKRMQWKAQLIEQSVKALTATPVSINDIAAGIEHGYGVDWLRIKLTGSYRHDLERYIYMPTKAGLGYQVLTPFIDKSGFLVFVDRGWIKTALKEPASRKNIKQPAGEISITGVTRIHKPNMTLFQADADMKNKVWYWYDRETLATSLPTGIGETSDGQLPIISPVFVQLEPGGEPNAVDWPKTPPVKVDLPNNHLQYAITWLSLAVIIFVMMVVFLRGQRLQRQEP